MVFLSIPNGKTLSIDVNPSATTISAFELLVPQPLVRYSLRLRYPSRDLDSNSVLLSDLGIGRFSTMIVHVPLLGGMPRLDFLNSKPPSNYVAGLGRGATGFTIRSDIGPARAAPDLPDRSAAAMAAAPGVGRGGGKSSKTDDDEETNQKFDEFEGNDAGLFSNAEYDHDDRYDKEADAFWEAREAKVKEEIEKYRASNPEITEQFIDLKRKLPADEWDNIPEIGDYSFRNKKFDPKSRAIGGSKTPCSQSHVTDLTAVGEGRGTVLSLNLDRLSDSWQTVVDPKGYLTDLKSMEITGDAGIYAFKRARLLLKSINKLNPKNPRGWIAAARLEERGGKIKEASFQIQEGCNECPENEDVWVEACRLAMSTNSEDAKAVIARAIKIIPNSVKLWLEAAKLEHDVKNKSKVLRKGLEHIPDSVRLWKAVVELANEEDTRILLYRAVECCPLSLDLWIGLARIETYENSKKVLNRAREKLPKEPAIWIAASKLEEANGNTAMVGKIVETGIKSLQREGVVIDREKWMEEAEVSDRFGFVATCQAIIKNTINVGVEEEDRTWVTPNIFN